MNQLVTIENNLTALQPHFAQVLPQGVTPDRIIRTVLMSIDRTPKLLKCSQQSILNSAMTCAVLGLECDGVTGQSFLIPFKDRCQNIIGYKGFNTLGGRSGYSINGGVVRVGDNFEFQEGTGGYARNQRKLGKEADRDVIAAWATAERPGFTPIVAVMSIDEILTIKARAPGARKNDSPWNNKADFPAMAEKTVKRRLARSMPLNLMVAAAAMEDQVELGRAAHIKPEGVVVEGEIVQDMERSEPQASPAQQSERILTENEYPLTWKEQTRAYQKIELWENGMLSGIERCSNEAELTEFATFNKETILKLYNDKETAAVGNRIINTFETHGIAIGDL